jgi:acyl-CoA synthetase (AMP-forming)/AMP-acid ligase II
VHVNLASPDPSDLALKPVRVIPLDLAALVYTSGSTGNPKGVMLSHQNMVFAQGSLVEYLRLDENDRILNFLPLAFDYGLYQALMTIHLGATLVLESTFAFPAAIVQRVLDEGVTVFPGVPTVFATLLSLHRTNRVSMPSVRRFTNTAAHLPDDYVPGLLEMSPGALVYKMYGLTECKRVCYLEPELVLNKPLSVGKAIPGTETYLLDEAGKPVPPGTTGTLYVRGPHVMMGYWNLPAETEHMLKAGKYPGERVLCTHDFFREDDEGFLYFMGRSDDIIKSRGEKVSPVEVENALSTVPGVKEVAVIGVPDELLGQAVRAYVVLDPSVEFTEQAFKRQASSRLENFMVPRDVVFVDDLPKTATGKVRKKSLIEQA